MEFDQLAHVLEVLPARVTVFDGFGCITYRNERARESGAQSLDLRALVADTRPRRLDGRAYKIDEFPAIRSLRGEVIIAEELLMRDGPTDVTCFVSAAPLRDGAGRVVGGMQTEQPPLELSWQSERNAFVSVLLHELRGPTSAAWGQLQMARRRLARGGDIDEALSTAERTLRALARLLTDVAPQATALTSMFTVVRAPTDVGALVRRVVDRHAVAHHVRVLAPNEPAIADVDADRIEQVLENLLTNAERYTPAGGTILVTIDEPTHEATRIRVRDWGIGILPADRPRLFVAFQRGSNVTDRRGSGLGLYISRVIALRHGGDLTYEATDGPGSTLQLVVPSRAGSRPPGPLRDDGRETAVERRDHRNVQLEGEWIMPNDRGGSQRGFAAMSEEERRKIAEKGGEAVSKDRRHMSEIGRKGGEASVESRDRRDESRDGRS